MRSHDQVLPLSFLVYRLQDGFIHNWLAAGPQAIPLNQPADPQQMAARVRDPDPGISGTPCERAKFTPAGPSDVAAPLTWRYLRCAEDHLADFSVVYPARHSLRAWAYAELVAPVPQVTRLSLYAFGPVHLWLNDLPILYTEHFSTRLAPAGQAEVRLVQGVNRILLRLEQWSEGPTPFAVALRVEGEQTARVRVRLPTHNDAGRHYAAERVAQRAYLERDLYAGSDAVHVKWPRSLRAGRPVLLRVEKPSGAIVGEAQPIVTAGLSQHILEAGWVKDGCYSVRILPDFEEFVRGLRVSYDLDVNLLHSSYVEEPQGDQSRRALEALQHAAWWTEGLFAQLASMSLGLWKQVNAKEIERAMTTVSAHDKERYLLLIGLLLMAYRHMADSSFPKALAPQLQACLLNFDYSFDYSAAGDEQEMRGLNDDTAILRHACSILAGQFFPARVFRHSGERGSRLQRRGEEAALAWFARRAHGGFAAWDSPEGFAAMLLGLVVLVDHAASSHLAELAAATADKVLFSLAANSLRGIFGSTHGATSASSITDSRMEPTSPIARLLWGAGSWNQHMAAALALATSRKYGCPPLLQLIALDAADSLWSRERHVTAWQPAAPEPLPRAEVNKVTYRTPDYLLASAQDYRPGEAGYDEHIWQATLSPSAVVFVNHPVCMSQRDAYQPNFWRGNGVLPRVAQWRDLLIALYCLPSDDWLGYTHAHFPIAALDDYTLRGGWAFARKGDAYLALTAARGLSLIKHGPAAFRELRSYGLENVWLCQMGRAGQDGSFAKFQAAVLACPIAFDGLTVSLVSMRGDAIRFGWTAPFTVQGEAQPLTDFPHYESPYCVATLGTPELEVRYQEWTLRLNLDPSEG